MTENKLVQILAEEINGGNYGGRWTDTPYPYSKFRSIAKHIMDELAKETSYSDGPPGALGLFALVAQGQNVLSDNYKPSRLENESGSKE